MNDGNIGNRDTKVSNDTNNTRNIKSSSPIVDYLNKTSSSDSDADKTDNDLDYDYQVHILIQKN